MGKIVGTMALCDFPMWKKCLKSLCDNVDELYIRFDMRVGDKRLLEEARDSFPEIQDVHLSYKKWDKVNWREELLRMLDDVQPEIVVNLDEDEAFEGDIREDLKVFYNSKYNQLGFNYVVPMPTEDNWKFRSGTKPYPSKYHIKAFKWKPGLSFYPYRARARVSSYGKHDVILAQKKIEHYCFYTAKLRAEKLDECKARRR